MTLYELSKEYEQTAALIRVRIVELEQRRKEAQDDQRRLQLDGRLRPLRTMYRETRAVARYLERYYNKPSPRTGGSRYTDHINRRERR